MPSGKSATATSSPITIGSIGARPHVCIGLPSSSVPFERTSEPSPCTRDRTRNDPTGTRATSSRTSPSRSVARACIETPRPLATPQRATTLVTTPASSRQKTPANSWFDDSEGPSGARPQAPPIAHVQGESRSPNPPTHAVVVSVDEKTLIQALQRTRLPLPPRTGRAVRHTHDYERRGVIDLHPAPPGGRHRTRHARRSGASSKGRRALSSWEVHVPPSHRIAADTIGMPGPSFGTGRRG